jgi:hypothetical protein
MTELSVEQQANQLAASYLNKAGAISCQFVIKLKKVSPEVQAATNKRLVELGHPPYDLFGKKTRDRKPRQRQLQRQLTGEPKVLNDEQKLGEDALIKLLDEIRLDRAAVTNFLRELGTTEDNVREQLAKLRGVPYDGPLHDPFKDMYRPAHKHVRHNKAEIAASKKCGCCFCRATFEPNAIYTYVEGDTAICPNCGIDAVIGDFSGYEMSEEFLTAMFRYWFSVPIRLRAARPIAPLGAIASTVKSESTSSATEPESTQSTIPSHLQETAPAGIGAALLGSLADDEDDEDEVKTVQPITPVVLNKEDEEEDEDDWEEDDDWEDEEDWDDDEDDEDE